MKWLIALLFCLPAFSEVIVSPNMNLPVPIVGTTTGPEWANDINSCMTSIDEHDHTPGKGVPISSAAININSDLSLNGNSLTNIKSDIFSAQTSFGTTQSIYVVSPDLIYNDSNGNVIRITQNGSVSGSSGTITGLPSGTASASYQSVGGTFQFQSATNTPANGTFASLSIAQQTTNPNTITIKSPNSLASSYNFTLPTSVPSALSLLAMSTSGVLSTVPYHAPTIQKLTAASGTYTLPTSPSPLYLHIKMAGAGGGGGAANANAGSAGGSTTFGSSLLTCNGGSGGDPNTAGSGGAGGTATINSPAIGNAITGGYGSTGTANTAGGTMTPAGGVGGANAFGGQGAAYTVTGKAGVTNTGGGGGGGVSTSTTQNGGSGGGAGGYIEAFISSPSATYAYTVGTGGAGGTSSGGAAGGAGADGVIYVEEYYQ